MGKHIICGIPVDFPFEPYPCQLIYMEQVIHSLQSKEHALLESPTGTGKTLCLLCATLAWQEHERQKREASGQVQIHTGSSGKWNTKESNKPKPGQDNDPDEDQNQESSTTPVLIYASRTHGQLSQVVQELKTTSYAPKIAILASRQYLCLHPDVQKERGAAQVHKCKFLCSHHKCQYKSGYDAKFGKKKTTKTTQEPHESSKVRKKGKHPISEVCDIEELVAKLSQVDICPFFTSRDMTLTADLILLPYNYLLDPVYRSSVGLGLERKVLIFDEGHNVESVAGDAMSFELSTTDLAGCIREVNACLESFEENYGELAKRLELEKLNLQSLATLKLLFLNIEEHLDGYTLPRDGSGLSKVRSAVFE